MTIGNEGHLFVALKLKHGADTEEIHPIVLRYEGNEPCIPIRLTRIAAVEDTTLLVIPRTAVAYLRDYNPNLAVSLYEIFAAFMGRRLRKMTGRLFAPITY